MKQRFKKVSTADITPQQNSASDRAPLICQACGGSARFIPLYRFNTAGMHAEMLMPQMPTIRCAGCGQVFQWESPSSPRSHDGGWMRVGLLQEVERLYLENPPKEDGTARV